MQPESLRSLPYLVHTNRELGLMIKGVKPLALLGYIKGQEIDFVLRYLKMFDRHVAAGRFSRQEVIRPVPKLSHLAYHEIFYTLPGEEWRVGAMRELLSLPGKWSFARERRFGELLGYEDWQNDLWLSRLPPRDDA